MCMYIYIYMCVHICIYVNEYICLFNAHNNPEVGTIINPTVIDEETEVQRGKVICPRATQLVSNKAKIQTQGEVKWGREQKTNGRKAGVKRCPSCSLQDLRTVLNSKKTIITQHGSYSGSESLCVAILLSTKLSVSQRT